MLKEEEEEVEVNVVELFFNEIIAYACFCKSWNFKINKTYMLGDIQ